MQDTFVVRWNTPDGGITEGPLHVLWSLIESYRIDIFDVSLSRITNDFITFLKTAEAISLELSSEFALMAAHLVYLKSKALLPDPGFEEEDFDPPIPKELVEKLLEHKKFQMASQKLAELEKIALGMFTRETNIVLEDDENWLDVSLIDLIAAFNALLNQDIEKSEEIEILSTFQRKYTVEDKLTFIQEKLKESKEFLFSDLLEEEEPNKEEIVATFLAILELVKNKYARVVQHRIFGTIKIIAVERDWNRTENF